MTLPRPNLADRNPWWLIIALNCVWVRVAVGALLALLLCGEGWGQTGQWKLQDNAASTTVLATFGSNGTAARNTSLTAVSTSGLGTALPIAYDANGTSDIINLGNQGDITGTMTVCGWVRPDATNTLRTIIARRNGGTIAWHFRISSGKVSFLPTSGAVVDGATNVSTGVWTHVAAVVESGTVTVYINGVSDGSAGSKTLSSVAVDAYIGAHSSTPAGFFDGQLADVRIYNSNQSANLAAIMAEKDTPGDPEIDSTDLIAVWECDESSGALLPAYGELSPTENGGTIAGATGKIGGARDLERNNSQFFQLANQAAIQFGDSSYTVGGWFQFESLNVRHQLIAKDEHDVTANRDWGLWYDNSNNRFKWDTWGSGGSYTNVTANNFGAVSTGTWYHVVGVYNAATDIQTLYVNGISDSTSAGTRQAAGTAAMRIGARASTLPDYHDGPVDQVFIFGRALDSSEVSDLYNGGSGLEDWWPENPAIYPQIIISQLDQRQRRQQSHFDTYGVYALAL